MLIRLEMHVAREKWAAALGLEWPALYLERFGEYSFGRIEWGISADEVKAQLVGNLVEVKGEEAWEPP